VTLLGGHADWALVNVGGKRQLGNSNGGFRSIMNAPMMEVRKALMP